MLCIGVLLVVLLFLVVSLFLVWYYQGASAGVRGLGARVGPAADLRRAPGVRGLLARQINYTISLSLSLSFSLSLSLYNHLSLYIYIYVMKYIA